MTLKEYFGDWLKVIDKVELARIVKWLSKQDSETLCPSPKDVFKAFRVCPYNDCKVVILGMDPYPQKGVAQGILFANSADTTEEQLSPSLKVVKEAMINYEIPHGSVIFDNTLESVARQGVLLINASLTCEISRTGVHSSIWKPFMVKFLTNMSTLNSGVVYVLFGSYAQSFRSYITGQQHIITDYHPAYYARINQKMPYSTFTKINEIIEGIYKTKIEYFKEV